MLRKVKEFIKLRNKKRMCWDLLFFNSKALCSQTLHCRCIQYKKSSEPLPQEYDVLCAQ